METKKTIYSKLLDFQNNVDVIKKDATNPHFKNTYASLPNILGAVKPILNALKLVLTQPIIDGYVYTVITDTESGESINSAIKISEGLGAQQYGSAITYFRRYTLTSLLGLEIDDDDDANAASSPKEPKELKFESTTHDKQWLNKFEKDKKTITENWQKVTNAIANGTHTIAQVESKYKLSKELKAELIQIQQTGL